MYYSWKFKLDTGFQGTPSFTHIFQIKSDLGAPIMTLTPRVSTFEITGRAAGSSPNTELAKFLGVWVVVTLKVLYSDSGRIELNIRRLSDRSGAVQLRRATRTCGTPAPAPTTRKFGIYRSLNNRGMLRDEQVRFADFCASKISAAECADESLPPPMGGSDAGGGGGGPDGGTAGDAGGGGAGGSSGTGGNSADRRQRGLAAAAGRAAVAAPAARAGPAAAPGGSGAGGSGGSSAAGGTGGSSSTGGSGGSTRTGGRGGSTPSPEPSRPAASGGCRYDAQSGGRCVARLAGWPGPDGRRRPAGPAPSLS